MTDKTSKPAQAIPRLEALSQRLETSFDGVTTVWRKWPAQTPQLSPIVLFHGGFGSWTHWFLVIEKLQKYADVIAVDLPGLGSSDDVPLPHTPEKMSRILVEGLQQIFSEEPFHLVGFSYGGMLGSRVAAEMKEQCLTFTAVGASGFGDLHYIVEGIELPAPDAAASQVDQIMRRNLQLLMFTPETPVDDLSLYIHSSNVAKARVKSRRMSVSDELLKALPRIKARLGGIWGAEDATGGGRAAIQQRADLFKAHQPDAAFEIIENAGHWVMHQQPDTFVKTLLSQIHTSQAEG